jgi:predicted aspartyl protease
MKRFIRVFPFILILILNTTLYAGGNTYHIDKDKGGVFIQTDGYGSWYIDPDEMEGINVGDKGTYITGSDRNGRYIDTNHHGRFYLNSKNTYEDTTSGENNTSVGQHETKVVIKGNQVLVPTVIINGGNRVEAMLLLDTGASIVALKKDIIDRLNVTEAQDAEFVNANGVKTKTKVGMVEQVKAGPVSKSNIYISVLVQEGNALEFDGLLGMNFLRDLEYKIDFNKQIITWKK